MPPTPTALLMTVLALLLLPTCSCFRTVARVSEFPAGDEAEGSYCALGSAAPAVVHRRELRRRGGGGGGGKPRRRPHEEEEVGGVG